MSVVLRGGGLAGGGFLHRHRDSSTVITKRISSVGVAGRGINPTVTVERATWLPGLDPPLYLDGK